MGLKFSNEWEGQIGFDGVLLANSFKKEHASPEVELLRVFNILA